MRILKKNVPKADTIAPAPSAPSNPAPTTSSGGKRPPTPPPIFTDTPLPSQKQLEKQLTWGLNAMTQRVLYFHHYYFFVLDKYVKSGVDVDKEFPVRKKIGEGFVFPSRFSSSSFLHFLVPLVMFM